MGFVILSLVVWFWRGTAWPVRCAYPTTRNKPCRRWVAGEWYRCHDHSHKWTRKTDSHRVDPKLYRWQTSTRGVIKDRDDIQGGGFLRFASNRAGVLFYHGFARPPRSIYWQPLLDWWRKLRQLVGHLRARQKLGVAARIAPSESGVYSLLDLIIRATRVTLTLVSAGLVLVLAAQFISPGLHPHGPRVAIEYGATFLFIGAWMTVKNGIMQTTPTWQQDAWSQTLTLISAIFAGLILAGILDIWARSLATSLGVDVKQLLLGALLLLLFVLTSNQGTKRRRRRRRRMTKPTTCPTSFSTATPEGLEAGACRRSILAAIRRFSAGRGR
jgi:uncharacterized membrane protein YidH (DUF202 family)